MVSVTLREDVPRGDYGAKRRLGAPDGEGELRLLLLGQVALEFRANHLLALLRGGGLGGPLHRGEDLEEQHRHLEAE